MKILVKNNATILKSNVARGDSAVMQPASKPQLFQNPNYYSVTHSKSGGKNAYYKNFSSTFEHSHFSDNSPVSISPPKPKFGRGAASKNIRLNTSLAHVWKPISQRPVAKKNIKLGPMPTELKNSKSKKTIARERKLLPPEIRRQKMLETLARGRELYRQRLATETPEERAERLWKIQEKKRKNKEAGITPKRRTEEQRLQRLARTRERLARETAVPGSSAKPKSQLTEEQRLQRLARKRERRRERLASETPEERAERLRKIQEKKRTNKEAGITPKRRTEEQRLQKLARARELRRERRARETAVPGSSTKPKSPLTEEKRLQKLARARELRRERLARETSTEREERLYKRREQERLKKKAPQVKPTIKEQRQLRKRKQLKANEDDDLRKEHGNAKQKQKQDAKVDKTVQMIPKRRSNRKRNLNWK